MNGTDLSNALTNSFYSMDRPIFIILLIHGKVTSHEVFSVKNDAIDGDFILNEPSAFVIE